MSKVLKILSKSPQQTREVGSTLAKQLKPGAVVGLRGPLGAGKTCLVQGIAAGVGAKIKASSPSFVMVNHYPGQTDVYHFDLYRLKNPEELLDLGAEEYFYGNGICLVEWAEKAGSILPEKRWEIMINLLSENEREILIKELSPK